MGRRFDIVTIRPTIIEIGGVEVEQPEIVVPEISFVSKTYKTVTFEFINADVTAAEYQIYRLKVAPESIEDYDPVLEGELVKVITDPTIPFEDDTVESGSRYIYQLKVRYHLGTVTQLPDPTLPSEPGSEGVLLAEGGIANYDVVVANPSASQGVIDEADELASYLSQITGATFNRTAVSGSTWTSESSGIVVGTPDNFPNLGYDAYFDINDPMRLDEHIIKSHANGVHIIGATNLAVRLGVWTFLKELGYRHYFPMPEWEIIPSIPNLEVDLDQFESPDYIARQAPERTSWSDSHTSSYSQFWARWEWHNRIRFSFNISNTHMYGHLVDRNEAEFAANSIPTEGVLLENSWTSHPYTSGTTKFRMSERGLVNIVIQDALTRLQNNPSTRSISMDPSDSGNWSGSSDVKEWNFDPVTQGYGWVTVDNASDTNANGTYLRDDVTDLLTNENGWYFEYDDETWYLKDSGDSIQATGQQGIRIHETSWIGDESGIEVEAEYADYQGSHITDRVIFLANEVAKEINDWSLQEGHGDKYVGIQAYNLHMAPPNISVHPNICALIATSFTTAGLSFTELCNAWASKGAILGERGYYDTFVWSQGRGRHGTTSNLQGVANRIPNNYDLGVRFIRANSTDAWPLNGIAFYLSTRLLWDRFDGTAESIYEEFLEDCYGPVKEDMRNFHDLFISTSPPRTRDDILARCYKALKDSYAKNPGAEIVARLNQCAMYLRYVELYHILPREDGAEEQSMTSATHEIGVYTYRMMGHMLSPVTQLYRHMRRDNTSWVNEFGSPPSYPIVRQNVGVENLVDDPPYRSDQPITQEEIDTYVEEGDTNYEEFNIDFDYVEYDDDTLVPAKEALNLPDTPQGDQGWYFRYNYTEQCFVWLEEGDQQIHLYARGGRIWRNAGDVRFTLLSPLDVLVEPVDRNLVPPIRPWYHSIEISGIPSPDEGANGKYKMVQAFTGSRDYYMQNWDFEETAPKNNWKFEMEFQEEGESPLQGWWVLKDETDAVRSTSDTFPIEEDDGEGGWDTINFSYRVEPWNATGWGGLLEGVSLVVEEGFKLSSPYHGIHTLNWRDINGGFLVDWEEGQRFVMKGTIDRRFRLQRNAVLYFYVPKGTTKVGGYASSFKRLWIRDKEGNTIFSGGEAPDPASGYFSWDVPEGQDGGLWRLSGDWARRIGFGSIPPYMARSSDELLLPQEVIETDKQT